MTENLAVHKPVLLSEVVALMMTDPEGCYVDGTFGRGGHTRALLGALQPGARVLAFDKDPQAVAEGQRLSQSDVRLEMVHGSFADLQPQLAQRGWLGKTSGILLDLGVSSPQLDQAERGFSFLQAGPLDMRMDNSSGLTAAQWLADAAEEEISQVLRDYAEERFHRRIARAIVTQRQISRIETTQDLARLIEATIPVREKHKHPATRTFQAIRIHLNQELDDLQTALQAVPPCLKSGGRLLVISFHSLEDRIVKHYIREQEKGPELPRGLPLREFERLHMGKLRSIGKPVKPGDQECALNPRARSAILRVAERCAA